jgi:hypothetical protein
MPQVATSAEDKLAYLGSRLAERATILHSSVAWYRRRHYTATMSTVVFSGGITILAGWKPELGSWATNLILGLGALTTVVSAWGAFFSPRDSWLLYANTLGRLRALQADVEFMTRPPNDLSATNSFVGIRLSWMSTAVLGESSDRRKAKGPNHRCSRAAPPAVERQI